MKSAVRCLVPLCARHTYIVVGRDHYEEVFDSGHDHRDGEHGQDRRDDGEEHPAERLHRDGLRGQAQEVNTELLRKTTEVWIEGFRKQTELSQDMAQQFFEKAEDQAHAYQDFFGQWGFPFTSFPFVRMSYDPFGFWREWAQTVQQTARDTRERTAWNTQKMASEETARVIETTAPPTNGSLLIAGYDEKSVGEITARLSALTADQLQRLKDYERRNKNRGTLIREIDRRLGAAS
jgi:bZIP Maf transcription factor